MRGEDSSWQGKTDLVFYEDTLDAPACQDMLKNSLLPAAKEWFGDEKEGWELQQRQSDLPHGKVHEGLVGEA